MATSTAQGSSRDATLHSPADTPSAQHRKDHDGTVVGVWPSSAACASSSPTTPRGSSFASSSPAEPAYMPRRTALPLSELLSPAAAASGGADNEPTPETDDNSSSPTSSPARGVRPTTPTPETSLSSLSPHSQSPLTTQQQPPSETDNEAPNCSSSSSCRACAQCGRDQSPCWRRGPNRTMLCNSCGLRYARHVRRAKDEEDEAVKRAAQNPHSYTASGVGGVDPCRGVSVLIQSYDPQGRPVSFPVESAAHVNGHVVHLQALPQMFSQFQATQVPNGLTAGFPGLAMHASSSVVPVFPSSSPYAAAATNPMPTQNYLFPASPTLMPMPFMPTSPMPMEPTHVGAGSIVIPAPLRSFASPQAPVGAGPQASPPTTAFQTTAQPQLVQVLSQPYGHQNPLSYVSFLLPAMVQQHIEPRQLPAEALLKLAQQLPSQSAPITATTTTRPKPATPNLSLPLALPQFTSLSDVINDSQRYVKQQPTTGGGMDRKRKVEASPATFPPILKKSRTDSDARIAVQALVPQPSGRVLKHFT